MMSSESSPLSSPVRCGTAYGPCRSSALRPAFRRIGVLPIGHQLGEQARLEIPRRHPDGAIPHHGGGILHCGENDRGTSRLSTPSLERRQPLLWRELRCHT